MDQILYTKGLIKKEICSFSFDVSSMLSPSHHVMLTKLFVRIAFWFGIPLVNEFAKGENKALIFLLGPQTHAHSQWL